MRIYKYINGLTLQRIRDEKVKPVLVVPLSLKKNEICIKELDNGSYLLHAIDFKKNINLLTIIRKE